MVPQVTHSQLNGSVQKVITTIKQQFTTFICDFWLQIGYCNITSDWSQSVSSLSLLFKVFFGWRLPHSSFCSSHEWHEQSWWNLKEIFTSLYWWPDAILKVICRRSRSQQVVEAMKAYTLTCGVKVRLVTNMLLLFFLHSYADDLARAQSADANQVCKRSARKEPGVRMPYAYRCLCAQKNDGNFLFSCIDWLNMFFSRPRTRVVVLCISFEFETVASTYTYIHKSFFV